MIKSSGSSSNQSGVIRRNVLAGTAAIAGAGALPFAMPKPAIAAGPVEIVHWSWLSASDGEVWAKMIDAFNAANKDKGMTIRMEVVPDDQYTTKVLAAVASGKGPDFGWGTAGKAAGLARDEVTVPLDDLIKKAGLDLSDFQDAPIQASRYPKYDNKIFMIPMDLMSLQPEINTDIAKEVGPRSVEAADRRQDAARLGQGDDEDGGRQGHAFGHHDDRRRGAADGHLGHRFRANGLPARQRRFEDRLRQSRRRQGRDAVDSRPVRQIQGVDARRHRPLQGVSARGRAASSGPGRGRSTAISAKSCPSKPRCSPRSATRFAPIAKSAGSNFTRRATRAATKPPCRR